MRDSDVYLATGQTEVTQRRGTKVGAMRTLELDLESGLASG